ncbi:molybdopterin molybdotransferase MoeA [Streptomyces virginiae]|uniref:molybdopterin molybdotransferase MoeA n=1 Tax=Streptomyces virginiae TaxID=1961 RepID=UPI002E3493DB|nr:molybdopterin molybdotransferase MoeA [Streptomyces virginiae]
MPPTTAAGTVPAAGTAPATAPALASHAASALASAPRGPARHPVVSWARARVLAHGAACPLPARTVPLRDAAGLTLADGLPTLRPLPGFDTAAMDGYAVSGTGPWRVRAAVRAGAPWAGVLGAAECVEISTGAEVPTGAHAVLPLESAVTTDDGRVSGPVPPPGRHIRRTGEDAPAGRRLAPAGTRIGPALLGLAASCGHDTLPVRPRPRVGVLVTGDELDHAGVPGPGRVRDALGPLLPALIAELGGETAEVGYVPDRPVGRLSGAVRAVRDADVVVVTGSTSVGPTDQLRRLLADAGARMVVDTVACRPGHPMLLAELAPERWVVGLPGNPYAALVAARTLLGPLIAGLSGRALDPLPHVPVHGRARPAGGPTRLVPVTWDGTRARITDGHRAAFLQGAAVGDALAAIPPDWTDGSAAPLLLTAG